MYKRIYIETQRTILRNLETDDAERFYALNLDKEVLKFTGDKPFENIQTAKDFITNYDQYEKYGVGRLAVMEKITSKFIGWCGLKYSHDKDEYDIGFRFFRQYWNKGFATETAKVCLEFGFNELGLCRIVGRAMKENIASIKVLEKIGMTFKESFDFDGQEGEIFEITNKEYEERSPNR
ncbi:GNAT family N-acetyltransferase [Mariniradius saccharolyticus]|nr:GNAT family N-acetyltransferase [Mariniradius saccharolyticus]